MSGFDDAITVGRVVGLWRYPVKSMAAEALTEANLSWHGLAGDRRWAFIRNGVERSGFPWLTLRDRVDMRHYHPVFSDPGRPDSSTVRVTTPDGTVFDVIDPALGKDLAEGGASVIKQNRGIFDTFPLSLITTQTIGKLGEMVGDQLDVQRFRPNILVEASENKPFIEDDWVGCTLRLGNARIRVDKRDGRCVVITIDPDSDKKNPAILRAVAGARAGCLGVYGSTVKPGLVAVNDAVRIELYSGKGEAS
jgi:MOSC domain-containing protein